MRRTGLCVAVVLTVSVGCRDGPNGIIAPEDTAARLERQDLASRAALLAVKDIFDDPFVRELVDDLGVQGSGFRQATRAMTAPFVREDLRALSQMFTSTTPRSIERGVDDEVLKTVLGLIIDDATRVADSHFERPDGPTGSVRRR